jgi:hypothetical protein
MDTAPDVNLNTPSAMGGGAAPNLPAAPQPQVTQQQAPQPTPQELSIGHDTLFGRAAKALMGSGTQYSVDQNGNTVATQSPNTFSQFARNVLSAAILGGAAGANGNPQQGFAGGAVRGGAATIQNGEQQDQLKRAQAQKDFQQQQLAAREKREADTALSEDQLRKANAAQANAATYRLNVESQGMSLDQHEKIANAGKAHVAAYESAGIKPLFKDIPETEMLDIQKNRPDASTFDWAATGVKPYINPKTGQPDYQMTYTAYDPKGNVTISQAQVDQWKKDGLDKFHPELVNTLKPGKQLSTQEFIAVKQADETLQADNIKREKESLSTDEGKARIKNLNAEAAAHNATAARENALATATKEEKTKQEALSKALDELNKVGGDFDKLTPKSRVIIGETQASLIPSMNAEVKQILSDDPGDSQGKAKQLMGQIDDLRSLSMQAIKHTAANPPAAALPVVTPETLPKGAITATNPTTKEQSYSTDGGKTWGLVKSAPPKSVNEQNAERRATVGGMIKSAIQNPLVP